MKIASATQRSQMPPCQMSCQYMQATTAGTAAIRPYVKILGSANGRPGTVIGLGVTASMNQRIPFLISHQKQPFCDHPHACNGCVDLRADLNLHLDPGVGRAQAGFQAKNRPFSCLRSTFALSLVNEAGREKSRKFCARS